MIDLYEVAGIKGVFLSNQVVDGQVRTYVTYNKGRDWQLLQAPATDLQGNTVYCEQVFEEEYSIPVPRRSAVLTSHRRHVPLSFDEGQRWEQHSFTSSPLYVDGVLGEPGEDTLIMTYRLAAGSSPPERDGAALYPRLRSASRGRVIVLRLWIKAIFGHFSHRSEWQLVKIDFRSFFGRRCRPDDYQTWQLHNEVVVLEVVVLGLVGSAPRGLQLLTMEQSLVAPRGHNVTFLVFLEEGASATTGITVDFGDGTAVTYANTSAIEDGVTHAYGRVGIYHVSATARNRLGSDHVALYLHVSCESAKRSPGLIAAGPVGLVPGVGFVPRPDSSPESPNHTVTEKDLRGVAGCHGVWGNDFIKNLGQPRVKRHAGLYQELLGKGTENRNDKSLRRESPAGALRLSASRPEEERPYEDEEDEDGPRIRLLAPPVALRGAAVNLSTALEPGTVGAVTYYWWLDNKTEPVVTLNAGISCSFSTEGLHSVVVQASVGNTVHQDRGTVAVYGENRVAVTSVTSSGVDDAIAPFPPGDGGGDETTPP
ncbi:hypothetical protein CRUP_034563 [Coryphaenoides rupestris]|nr:hypothetical protein CRUP_034563 [Coryphaenoides rupestris]